MHTLNAAGSKHAALIIKQASPRRSITTFYFVQPSNGPITSLTSRDENIPHSLPEHAGGLLSPSRRPEPLVVSEPQEYPPVAAR